MNKTLISHIKRFVTISDHEESILMNFFTLQHFSKRGYLLKEGQVCKYLFFVDTGCLRMFFLNDKSAEQITHFAIEGWWMSDYFSFMDRSRSEYYIQAIEKSNILSIEFSQFNNLLQELPQMERYFRIIMQRALAASQLRIKYLYEMSKEDFYFHFCTSFPEFVQRVPQYMLASYLGLTPEYVSELRKKH